jgi:hypothetical protein
MRQSLHPALWAVAALGLTVPGPAQSQIRGSEKGSVSQTLDGTTLTVTEKDGRLRGHLPFPIHPGDELEFDLVPAGLNRFSAGLYRNDELFNVELGFTFDFEVMGEHASAIVMRGVEGTAFAEGERVASSR